MADALGKNPSARVAPVAIITGGGQAPRQLVAALQAAGTPYFLLALRGQADPAWVTTHPHGWVHWGEALKARDLLRQAGVQQVTFLGGVTRPKLSEVRPDWLALSKLPAIGLATLGDDGVLRGIAAAFASEGFQVVPAHTLWPSSLMPAGVLTSQRPNQQDWDDLRRAHQVALALGAADVGQAVVVRAGVVLALEAAEGTAAMLARVASLWPPIAGQPASGVLLKACKPQQDQRFDLPSIGAATIAQLHAAGLAGVALTAGQGLLLEREATLAAANQQGCFVLGYTVEHMGLAATAAR